MTAREYAYGTFRTMWKPSGGAIDGTLRVAPLPAEATLLYEHDSLPLPEIIRLVNKFSNNVMARRLLLTLGTARFGAPATAENGGDAIRLWLASRRIDRVRGVLALHELWSLSRSVTAGPCNFFPPTSPTSLSAAICARQRGTAPRAQRSEPSVY